jgi:RNA polymerase sigma-70 factor (ECF subfamily)
VVPPSGGRSSRLGVCNEVGRESSSGLVKLQVRALIDFRGSLRAAKRGDEDAFANIWREFHPGLLRYLRVKADSEAEDLAADMWCQVIRALGSFEGDEDGFRAWLYTTARNRLTDWYRGSHRRPDPIDHTNLLMMPASNNVESDAEENSATDAALALIAQLPPDQAEAVMLRIIAGLSVSSVAKIMRRTPGSVRVLCHRGLRRLEDALESEYPDLGSTGVELEFATSVAGAHPVATGSHLSEVRNG